MSIPNISSSKIVNTFKSGISKMSSALGGAVENALEKSPNKDKFLKAVKSLEPTGANNPFITMAGLMVGLVIVPRVITAKKRNPNNKEATKDEVKEILFRDVQTVAIILFLLKIMNSLIAAGATKITGIPMINKPYEKLFQANAKGLQGLKDKGKELIEHPIQKLKTVSKNILDTIHPTGGVLALNNDKIISSYSGFQSIDEVKKLFKDMPNHGGDNEKVFKKIMDTLIEKQEDAIKKLTTQTAQTTDVESLAISNKVIENAKNILELLKDTRNQKNAYEKFINNDKLDKRLENLLVDFFQDENNTLVYSAKKLNAALRTIALAIESTYLGFGLPALNQRRLEKKYLDKNPMDIKTTAPIRDIQKPKNNKYTNEEKIIFSSFIK